MPHDLAVILLKFRYILQGELYGKFPRKYADMLL